MQCRHSRESGNPFFWFKFNMDPRFREDDGMAVDLRITRAKV